MDGNKIAKSVWLAAEAEKVAVTYTPRKFPVIPSGSAQTFHAQKSQNPDAGFQINHILANRTGIAELERVSIEDRIEQEALSRLQTMQETAYKEAYDLGLEEGKAQAFREQSAAIQAQMDEFSQLLASIQNLKIELVNFNEAHLVKVVYQMAKKIAMQEIEQKPELVAEVMRQAAVDAQSEERLTVHVSAQDLAYLSEYQLREANNIEILAKIKLVEDPRVTKGGCIVETNYGVVDATVEQRVARLWAAISEKTPKVKDSVETTGSGED